MKVEWLIRWMTSVGSLVFFLLAASCTLDKMKIASLLADTPTTGADGVPLTSVLKLSPKSYVCILEPYRDDIDGKFEFSTEINQFLKENNFRGDEGAWTIIYGTARKWEFEKIRRRDIELVSTPTTFSSKVDYHICTYADRMLVIKVQEKRVALIERGAK